MAKFDSTIKLKNGYHPLKTQHSIVPLFHYSMIETITHVLKGTLYFDLARKIPRSVFFPAMGTNQFDKTASSQIRLVDALIVFGVLDEVLGMLIADRYHHAPTFNQLIQ